MKHLFALAAPLVFLILAACDLGDGMVMVELTVPCPMPLVVVTDTLNFPAEWNGACPWFYRDSSGALIIHKPRW